MLSAIQPASQSVNKSYVTGGVSDKGYSSMTQEDAQRLSQALSHSDLLEKSSEKADVSPTKPTRFDRSGFRLSLRKRSRRKENKSSTGSGK